MKSKSGTAGNPHHRDAIRSSAEQELQELGGATK